MRALQLIRSLHDWLLDVRLRVDTRIVIRKKDSISENRDARVCVPTPYFRLRMIFKRLRISKKDVFVDYGCGLGRVVCVAARLPFRKIYGVEIHPDIAEVARRNSRNVRNRQAPIEIIVDDVLARIHTSLLENPRNIRIVYFDPVCGALFNRTRWLKKREDLCFRITKHAVLFYESVPELD